MKKIITSSAILLGVCLIANTATAQLASDQPSQAAQAIAASKSTSSAKVAEVQTVSSAAATRTVTKVAPPITPVVVPSQGEEKIVTISSAQPVEQPKMQSNSAPAKKVE